VQLVQGVLALLALTHPPPVDGRGHLGDRRRLLCRKQKYKEGIEAYDRAGPRLNAVRELNPEALAIAETLDVLARATAERGATLTAARLLDDHRHVGVAGVVVLFVHFKDAADGRGQRRQVRPGVAVA
jgi:hypothetical protein